MLKCLYGATGGFKNENKKGRDRVRLEFGFDDEFKDLYRTYSTGTRKRKLLEIEGIDPKRLDIHSMSKEYFNNRITDISIDPNGNTGGGINFNSYYHETTKPLMKLEGYYLLWRYAKEKFGLERANELISAVWDGKIYHHDLVKTHLPYCLGVSTQNLMMEGRPYGQLHSKAPKRLDSYIAQTIEFTMDASQNFAGAIAVADILVNAAYFAHKEGLKIIKPTKDLEVGVRQAVEFVNNFDRKYVENQLQKFVHVVNNSFRIGADSPFTNVSIFDRPNLLRLFGEVEFPDGTYFVKDNLEYVMGVQELFGGFMSKGDPTSGVAYRFPITTFNISIDENNEVIDKEFLDWACEVNVDKGFANWYVNDGEKVASCCRMSNRVDGKKFKLDSFGNGGLNLGSIRCVTINLPDVAMEVVNSYPITYQEGFFFDELDKRLEMVKDLLLAQRAIIERRIEQGFLQFFKPLNWLSINMFFLTIGITGAYEMCKFMGYDILDKEGQSFVEKVLKYIEGKSEQFSEETGFDFNTEEIPSEGAAVALAKKGKVWYGEVQEYELYSNQFIPLIVDASIFERLEVAGKFAELLSGGSIVHINLTDKIKTKEQMKKIVELALKYKSSHFAINYAFGRCEDGHTSVVGQSNTCPICSKDIIEKYTRIVGYFVPLSSFNKVRRTYEFPRRVYMEADTVG